MNLYIEFETAMRKVASERPNVFVVKDVIIVYGASTVTILLTRAMAWFNAHATGWDYMMPVTGSDYPLVPLPQIEKILAFPKPHMPFLMAWTAGTQTHIFRLGSVMLHRTPCTLFIIHMHTCTVCIATCTQPYEHVHFREDSPSICRR